MAKLRSLTKKMAPRKGGDLAARLFAALKEEGCVRAGQRVGVAVSGGADSVALLGLLMELREKLGIVLCVAHFNHQLRGRASDADEAFVAKLAARHEVEFHVDRADVARLAARTKRNLEDAGRRARYEWFAALGAEHHLSWIVTAHTADDQAETVLAHILRGSGLAGLGGIHPRTESVLRPLLCFRRAELRSYLRLNHEKWREDASNRDTKRTRARIRWKLIPLLEKEFQTAAVEHLAALAARARESEALLAALSGQVRASVVSAGGGGLRILAKDLLAPCAMGNPAAVRALSGRLALDLAAQTKTHSGQVTTEHVRAILQLAEKGEPGKTLQLPGGLRVKREHDALLFYAANSIAHCDSE